MKKKIFLFSIIIFILIYSVNVNAANLIYSTSFENATVYDANRLNLEGLGQYSPTNWISNNSGGIWWIENKNNPTPGAPEPRTGNKMIVLYVPASSAGGIRSEFALVDIGNSAGTNSITLRNEAFISVWLWLPSDWTLNLTGNNWYELVNPTYCINPAYYPKHCLHIMKPNGPSGPYDLDYHDSLGPDAVGGEGWQHVIALSHLPNFVVPRGEWFNLKWWLKLHETDGAVKLWISSSYYGNDYLLTNYTGIQTRNSATQNPGYYWSASVGKVYLDGDNIAKYLYVDDLEVWDGIPNQESATLSGRLLDKSGSSLQATISVGSTNTNTNSNGDYSLSVPKNIYDINYSIQNFWIKLISFNLNSNQNNLVNYITRTSTQTSFQLNISNNQMTQVFSDKKPNNVTIGGTKANEVGSLAALTNNTWFYDSTEKKLYMIVSGGGTVQTCSDGTPYGQCSSTKPKYCDNGNLIDKCSICNCSTGYNCLANESCNSTTIADYYVIVSGGSYTAKNSSGNTILTGTNAATVISAVLNLMTSGQRVAFSGDFTIDSTIKVTKNIFMDWTQATVTSTSAMALDIRSSVTILGGHWIGTVNGFDGIRFSSTSGRNCIVDGIDAENFEIAMQYDSSYITVQNSNFHDNTHNNYFIVCNGNGHNIIRNNTFLRATGQYAPIGGRGAGIFIGPTSGYNLIENCEFGWLTSHAIYNDGSSAGADIGHNTIVNNSFHDDLGTGAGCHIKTHNNEIAYNTFDWNYVNAARAISLYSELSGYTANDNNIHHNTFTNCDYAVKLGHDLGTGSPTSRNLVHDNVFINCTNAFYFPTDNAVVNDNMLYYNDFHNCSRIFSASDASNLVQNTVIAYNNFDVAVSSSEVTMLQSTYTNTSIYGNGPNLPDFNVPSNKTIPPPP